MALIRQLWRDERAFIITIELILIATIMVLGLIVGMTTLRDAMVSEMDDIANAITAFDWGNDDNNNTSSSVNAPPDSCITYDSPPTDEV
jgi:Flp pilus assembly pilin Flp